MRVRFVWSPVLLASSLDMSAFISDAPSLFLFILIDLHNLLYSIVSV